MRVIENIFELEENLQESYVAIGTFDGVHYGHQKLIRNAVEKPRKWWEICSVYFFKSSYGTYRYLKSSKSDKYNRGKTLSIGKYGSGLCNFTIFYKGVC